MGLTSVELERRSPGRSIRRIRKLCFAISGACFLTLTVVILTPVLLMAWLLLGVVWLCHGRSYTQRNAGPYGRS